MLYGLVATASLMCTLGHNPARTFIGLRFVPWWLSGLRLLCGGALLFGAKVAVKPVMLMLLRAFFKHVAHLRVMEGEAAIIEKQPSFAHRGVLEELLEHRRYRLH